MAIASEGGHWIQLQRLSPVFSGKDVFFVSTNSGYKKLLGQAGFYKVVDANRWNKLKLIQLFFQVLRIVIKEKPDTIITTGAAPGLFAIIAGWVFKKNTIWIDSIANAEKLSMSGKIAKRFARYTFTQWKDLAHGKVQFSGTVIA